MSLVLPSAPLGTNEIILLIFIGSINDSEGFSVKCNDKWPLQSFWKNLTFITGSFKRNLSGFWKGFDSSLENSLIRQLEVKI